jgi:SRSO17 transposase
MWLKLEPFDYPSSDKNETTDYVAKQYIGNLGKTANGIVSVNAYAVLETITYPLLFKIYKPKSRLKTDDVLF